MSEGFALVTGGSRGIGRAVAVRLARDGRPVAVNFRQDAEGAAATVAEIEASGGTAHAVQGDVGAAGVATAMVEQLEERFGPIAVLVNNAGVRADNLAVSMSDEEWDQVLESNVTGAFRLTRRALKTMIRARWGRIVNVTSVAASKANPGQANYAASKAGLAALTRTVAAEVARRNVTVNAVSPGVIDTGFLGDTGIAERLGPLIPARRLGSPEEVAACVGFLASEEASYVTGAVLTVDGGLSA